MRARNIKPGFWKNEDLVELPFEHRLLFIGLWMLADREGRLEDRPKRIKMEIFPADSVNVDAGLEDLATAGLIERYEAHSLRLIVITKFVEHQSPHHTEKRSELPGRRQHTVTPEAEPEHSPASAEPSRTPDPEPTDKEPCVNGEPTVNPQEQHGGNPPDSLNPDSPNPDSKTHGPSASDEPRDADRQTRGRYPPEFEAAWQAYPSRPGSNPKRRAYHCWNARIQTGASADEILAGVQRYAAFIEATERSNTEFVMQAVRFFGTELEFTKPWRPPSQLPGAGGGARTQERDWSKVDYSRGVTSDGRF